MLPLCACAVEAKAGDRRVGGVRGSLAKSGLAAPYAHNSYSLDDFTGRVESLDFNLITIVAQVKLFPVTTKTKKKKNISLLIF